jgi:hypothetical protein
MIGLIFSCPMDEEMEDCPLKQLRKLPLYERIKAFEAMPLKQKELIQQHHEECLARRERKSF